MQVTGTPRLQDAGVARRDHQEDSQANADADADADANESVDEAQEAIACPVCGGSRSEVVLVARDRLFGRPGTYPMVQCKRCTMRYLSPRPTLEALGAHYPNDYFPYKTREEEHPLMRMFMPMADAQRWGAAIRRLERGRGRVTPETRVCDVGCGQNGFLVALQRQRGCLGVGVDFKAEMVEYVRDRLKMPVKHGTLMDARFEAGQFDLVTMNEYLEHEPDPRAVLMEARRVTKKGGHIAVEVPFIDSAPAKLFGSRWSMVDAPRHLSYFTRHTLGELLRQCGYRLTHVETFQVPMLLGLSVLQAFGARNIGRMGLIESTLALLASLPFYLVYPWMDELMVAVAEAE
jgi:ubiquinone/menaquinone biosynthesis C-methylase UbiE